VKRHFGYDAPGGLHQNRHGKSQYSTHATAHLPMIAQELAIHFRELLHEMANAQA
jgi:hypothetical protein